MSRLYRGVLLLALGAMIVTGAAAVVWYALGQFGYRVPYWFVAGVVALALGWSVATSGPGSPPPAPPRPAAPPQQTRSQLEALVLLRKEGQITSAQLNAALGGLVPREPAAPQAPRPGGRR